LGALTAKPFSFGGRPWETEYVDTLNWLDPYLSDIRLSICDDKPRSLLPINDIFIPDRERYLFSFPFVNRLLKEKIKKSAYLKQLLLPTPIKRKTCFIISHKLDFNLFMSIKNIAFSLPTCDLFLDIPRNNPYNFSPDETFLSFPLSCILIINLNLRTTSPHLFFLLSEKMKNEANSSFFSLGNYNSSPIINLGGVSRLKSFLRGTDYFLQSFTNFQHKLVFQVLIY
jgi:hypothetical protein